MKQIIIFSIISAVFSCRAQGIDTLTIVPDTLKINEISEIIVTASRVPEALLRSPISIDLLKASEAKNLGSPSVFDALELVKGVQIITPSLGFKVLNTRGFSNTTNVRFAQLVDGIDNQAPHIGAPIANALGANELDIDKIEIIPGTASALYGMNSINGLANIRTKSPFDYQGLSIQQQTGANHLGAIDQFSPKPFSQSNFRYAQSFKNKLAFKVNGAYSTGTDWVANNQNDLAPSLNSTTNLLGEENPAYDAVNSYGNESSNRKTLTLGGKKYVVSRTGYNESDIDDYSIHNFKGDFGIYLRPKQGNEFNITYKGAIINTIYQRSNRFRLNDYTVHQYSIDYKSPVFEIKTYLTQENTGKSYNIRSLAENMDRAFKSDTKWFTDYTTAFYTAQTNGLSVSDSHKFARGSADDGRYQPGTDSYNQKKEDLININNWDYGAALRVRSFLYHADGILNWNKLFKSFFQNINSELLTGFDYRNYIIIPDGNYFINPVDSTKNLTYSKIGGFTQLNKNLFDNKLRLSATIRFDKSDYFTVKTNPRFTVVYSPTKLFNFRFAYQSGYRFPSIFEGFSNVNSGGVKRVGGLEIMSRGIFENSYTKASIDIFQAQVNADVNNLGLTQQQAIDKNKDLLKKNPYTYLKPEYVRSLEIGFRGLAIQKKLFIDFDIYYNSYTDFIAQVEASIPKTSNLDSIPTYLYSKSTQDRYRLWTNSTSKIYNYGGSLGLKYRLNNHFSIQTNATYSKLDRTENKDGLEDGFNTPKWMINGTIICENIWKTLGSSISSRYQTQYDYVSFLVSGVVPKYWTMDAHVNYTFKKPGIMIKLGGTNLFNKTYYSILGGPSIGGYYYLNISYLIQTKKQIIQSNLD